MNRQLRRIQEKEDKKKEKKKAQAKAARREKVTRRRERFRRPKKSQSGDGPKSVKPRRRTNFLMRYGNYVAVFAAFFIAMQALLPEATTDEDFLGINAATFSLAIQLLYYFVFAHYLYMWLANRKVTQARTITFGLGAVLAVGLAVAQYFVPGLVLDLRLMLMALAAVALGVLAGQFVFERTT